ncbi:hypothetical protein K1719_018278 [Acacia pycnantha]|nr:hypothetical protein K1719_018278 [Acacia pycnantha]
MLLLSFLGRTGVAKSGVSESDLQSPLDNAWTSPRFFAPNSWFIIARFPSISNRCVAERACCCNLKLFKGWIAVKAVANVLVWMNIDIATIIPDASIGDYYDGV